MSQTIHLSWERSVFYHERKWSASTQSWPTLCDPMDCSPPGSSVYGILQARMLGWVAIPFSRGSSQPGIKPKSPASRADSLPSEPPGKPLPIIYQPPSLRSWYQMIYVFTILHFPNASPKVGIILPKGKGQYYYRECWTLERPSCRRLYLRLWAYRASVLPN